MSVAASTIIQDALIDLKVIGEQQTVSATRQARALRKLNDMLGTWSSEMLIQSLVVEDIALVTSKQIYTIGATGADLTTARPEMIHSAQYKTAQSNYYPLQIYTDEQQYGDIVTKNVGGIPRAIYFNPTHPNGTIYFDRLADADASLSLASWKPFTEFATAAATWSGPSEYRRLFTYGLAMELSPSFVVDESTLSRVAALYRDARSVIEKKTAIQRVPVLDLDDDFKQYGRPYNVLTDY